MKVPREKAAAKPVAKSAADLDAEMSAYFAVAKGEDPNKAALDSDLDGYFNQNKNG